MNKEENIIKIAIYLGEIYLAICDRVESKRKF